MKLESLLKFIVPSLFTKASFLNKGGVKFSMHI